jgi:preprotein translocase subunit SecE
MDNVEKVPLKTREATPPGSGGGILSKPQGWWTRLTDFLTEVRAEMKRVTWPGNKEVYATTVVVILTSAFFGAYLWGLDLVMSAALRWLYHALGASL